MNSTSRFFAATAICLLGGGLARAQTIQTVGAGSAVSAADFSANFNAFSDTNLADYAEGGLSVTTVGFEYDSFDSFGGAGDGSDFYYAGGGTRGNWITIETADLAEMSGVEFLYGNGWADGSTDSAGNPLFGLDSAVLYWQTLDDGVVDASGSVVLDVGTIVGFSDPTGFDELQVSATRGPATPPGVDALALDNLNVQLAPPPVAAVSDADGGLTLWMTVIIAGWGYWRRVRPACVRGQ